MLNNGFKRVIMLFMGENVFRNRHVPNFGMLDDSTIVKKSCKFDLCKIFIIISSRNLTKKLEMCRPFNIYIFNDVLDTAIIYAAKYGRIRFFKILNNIVPNFKVPLDAINMASKRGRVNVLTWLQKNGLFKFSKYAIVYASSMGHIFVLDWFVKNGYYIDIHYDFLDRSIELGYHKKIHFFCHEYPIDIFVMSVTSAALNGHINVLEWFQKSIYGFNYSHEAINAASKYGHICVLEWFKRNNYEIIYDYVTIDNACINGHVNVLLWFIQLGLEFKYSKFAIYNACTHGHLNILKFFWENNIPFKYHICTIDDTIKYGHHHILDWLTRKSSNLQYIVPRLKYDLE